MAHPLQKSMSGIAIEPACVNLFMHLKTRSCGKWATYRIDDTGSSVGGAPGLGGREGVTACGVAAGINEAEQSHGEAWTGAQQPSSAPWRLWHACPPYALCMPSCCHLAWLGMHSMALLRMVRR